MSVDVYSEGIRFFLKNVERKVKVFFYGPCIADVLNFCVFLRSGNAGCVWMIVVVRNECLQRWWVMLILVLHRISLASRYSWLCWHVDIAYYGLNQGWNSNQIATSSFSIMIGGPKNIYLRNLFSIDIFSRTVCIEYIIVKGDFG